MKQPRERVGLRIEDDIGFSLGRERQEPFLLSECIALLLYLLGGVVTLHFTVWTPLSPPIYCAAAVLAAALPLLCYLRRWRILLLSGGGVLYLLCAYLLREPLTQGARGLWSNLMEAVNRWFHTSFSLAGAAGEEPLSLFLVMGMIPMGILAELFAVKPRSLLSMLVLSFPFVWMAANLREQTLLSGVLLFVLSFFMIYGMKCAYLRSKSPGANRDFARGKRAVFQRGGVRERIHLLSNPQWMREGLWKNSLALLGLTLAAALCIGALIPRESYVWNDPLLNRYENPFLPPDSPAPAPPGNQAATGVGGGALGRFDRVEYENRVRLWILSTDYPVPMYLKGYVGSVYQGDHWEDLPDSVLQNPLFEEIWQFGLTPQTLSDRFHQQAGTLFQTLGLPLSGPAENQLILRKSPGDARIYAPYYLRHGSGDLSWTRERVVYDRVLAGEDLQEYQLGAYLYDPEQGSDLLQRQGLSAAASLKEAYYAGEDPRLTALLDAYGAFAGEQYTALPSEGLAGLRQEFSPALYARMGLAETVRYVQEYLAQRCVYDLAPGRTPEGRDFVSYFLYENRRGYCMHFASAATLIFRSMGIPARYAEGYIVTREDYINDRQAEILDKNAHAWTEIYVEPLGWVPIEVTPGFSAEAIAPPSYPQEEAPVQTESAASSESQGMQESSAAVSSEAAASSGPSELPPGEEETAVTPEEQKNLWRILIASAGILAGLAALAGGIWLRRAWILQRRKRNFLQRDRNRAALELYRYFLRLFSQQGLCPESGEDPMDFAARTAGEWERLFPAESEEAPVLAGQLGEMTRLAQEARFGGGMLSAGAVEEMLRYGKALFRLVCLQKNFLERLVCIWLRCLEPGPEKKAPRR